MAVQNQQIYDYWKDLSDPEIGGIDPYERPETGLGTYFAPDEHETGILGGVMDYAGLGSTGRAQEAMTFTEKYQPTTGQVRGLSEHLQGVLANDSPYIQRARTAAMEDASGRGLLGSSMATGAAEGAAIDRGLDVARGDLEAEQFNVGEKNRASQLRYDTATGLAGAAQQQGYQLDQASMDTLYQDYFRREEHQDALESMGHEFKYQSAMDYQKYLEELDLKVFDETSGRLNEILKQNSLLQSQYLKGWAEIASSDMDEGDKEARLTSYVDQINEALNNLAGYTSTEIVFGPTGEGSSEVYQIGAFNNTMDAARPVVSSVDPRPPVETGGLDSLV